MGANTFGKRLFDLTAALVLIVPAIVICAIVLPFVAFECRASPLFRQERVGRAGQPFRIFKLRTMYADTPHLGSHMVGRQSITRSGKWLRSLKIDELPQLLNVIAGTMSLVGPRPCLFSQIELIEERRKLGVDQLVPGVTGPAQVAGIDMSEPQRLAVADADYLQPWNLSRDVNLLIMTARGQGRGDAAGVGS